MWRYLSEVNKHFSSAVLSFSSFLFLHQDEEKRDSTFSSIICFTSFLFQAQEHERLVKIHFYLGLFR